MAIPQPCGSWNACISANPVTTTIGPYLTDATSAAINLLFWGIRGAFFAYALIYLILGIYRLVVGGDEDTYKTAKEALVRSLFAVFGLILVSSLPWFLAFILSLLGVADADNIFKNYTAWF